MRYFEVRLILEALDDADAHKLAGRVGSGPNGWWSLPDLARRGVSDSGQRAVLAAARQEAAA